jgi:ABC-type transport system substrate-binding protein
MKRRSILKSAAAIATTLSAPRIARADGPKTVNFAPQSDLASLDPVWTTADITRNYSLAVFDTLYAYDANFQVQPQMVEGHRVEDDGKTWELTLRDGLAFHDGQKVLARDCVASIQRFAKRNPFGQALMKRVDEIAAPSDTTIRFRLNKPFPLLRTALAEVYSAIMPTRLAETDPFKQRPVQVHGRRTYHRLPHRRRQEHGLCAAQGWHSQLQRGSEDRPRRSRGVEFHPRSRHRVRRPATGGDRLVGKPLVGPAAANQIL